MNESVIYAPDTREVQPAVSVQADPALQGSVEFAYGVAGRHVLPALNAPIYVSAGTPDYTVIYQSQIIRPAESTGGAIRATSEPTQALYSNTRSAYDGSAYFPTSVPGLSYSIWLLYPDGSFAATAPGPISLASGVTYSTGLGYVFNLHKVGRIANGTLAAGAVFQLVAGRARTLISDFSLTSAITIVTTP